MDHMKILKRAWQIVRSYRALWVFGIILALTTASGGNFSGGGGGSGRGGSGGDGSDAPMFENWDGFPIDQDLQDWVDSFDPTEVMQTVITVAIILVCVVLVLSVVFSIARYVAETALIKMVDDYEETSEPLSVRQGFRIGWSREAWRIFLVDLIVGVPLALLVFIPAALFAAMMVSFISADEFPIAPIVGGASGLLLFVLIAVLLGIALNLLKHFVWREVALNQAAIRPAFRTGYAMLRAHLKDAGLMWLIMIGVNIGWNIVLIPVAIVVLIIGGIVGLLIFLLTSGISSLFVGADTNWVIGAVVGVLFFIPVIAIPLTIVQGFFQVYVSSIWTLTYRELDALNGVEPESVPTLEPAV